MEAFLNKLFGAAVTKERRLALFTMPGRRSWHFSSVAVAAQHAAQEAKTKDVYFGVGLAGGNFNHRNCAADIVAIPGLWLDLDCQAPYRASKKPLPRSPDKARAILDRLPCPPTLLVNSGNGLHAYWLFKEPWLFAGDEQQQAEERSLAARLAHGWHGLACSHGEELGWKLENLGELARVLRLPGTFNHKGRQPVEVRVIEGHDERRYDPSDFEEFAGEAVTAASVSVGELGLVQNAEPPADKFAALLTMCPAFARTWNRQRADLPDQSQSAYDLSLANMAALHGWTDQEISNLVIAARRTHGEQPEKALRADYMTRTIGAARALAEERTVAGVDLSGLVGPDAGPPTLRQLVRAYPDLRKPVIEGLLREGETMNVISAPKIGKSWLVNDLALCVACGRPWLGFDVVRGDVLIIDNELHGETSAHRIPKVAQARGIPFDQVADHLYVENLRGQLQDVFNMEKYFLQFAPGRFKAVILDAFYRFIPREWDENDNGSMANIFNQIDRYANHLQCCFVLIHHTSKGNQSLKEITDVGAGAGAQSRASDTHVILRRHEQDDVVVMEAAVRSWSPVEPRCLRWAFPVWMPADDLDPSELRQEAGRQRGSRRDRDEPAEEARAWTPAALAEVLVTAEPRAKPAILAAANDLGLSDNKAGNLLDKAEALGLIYRWDMGRGRAGYATQAQPEQAPEPEVPSARQAVANMVRARPELTTSEIAEQCDVSARYVRQIRREIEEQDHAS